MARQSFRYEDAFGNVTGFTDQGLSVVPAWLQPLQALPTLQAPIGVKVFNGPRKVMTTVAVTAERAGPCPCLTSVGAGVPPQSPRPGGLPTTSSQTSPVPAGGVGYFPVMVIGNVRLTHISVRSR